MEGPVWAPHLGRGLYPVSAERGLCSVGNIAAWLPQSRSRFLIDNRKKKKLLWQKLNDVITVLLLRADRFFWPLWYF